MATRRRRTRTERVTASELRAGDVICFHNGPGLLVRWVEVDDDEVRVVTGGLIGPNTVGPSDYHGLIPCPPTTCFVRQVRGRPEVST